MRFLLALLLCAATGALAAVPTEITAEYELMHRTLGTIGHVSESYVRTGDTYAIRSVSRSEGALKIFIDDSIILESSGKVARSGLVPLAFGQRRANTAKGEVKATFDWDKGIMLSVQGDSVTSVPLPRDTQDRISVLYQFMNIAPGHDEVAMHMSNGRKIELYTYRLVDEARLATPAGEFDTLHYTRVTESPKESRLEVWIAKDRFNFPVRIVFDDPRGVRLEQTLVSLQSR